MSAVLGASGRPMLELGGERAWLQRVKGDICVTYQWLHAGQREPSACIVLFPTTMKMDGGAYCIPQENAHAYADNRGNPTPQLVASAFNAAISMGFFPDKSTVHRIVDIIIDGIPDLIRMPSEMPKSLEIARPVLGIEARASIDGKTIAEEVL